MGTEGLLRGDPMKEYASKHVEGTSDVVKEEAASESDEGTLPSRGSAEVDASNYDPDCA